MCVRGLVRVLERGQLSVSGGWCGCWSEGSYVCHFSITAGLAQHGAAWLSMAQHGTASHSTGHSSVYMSSHTARQHGGGQRLGGLEHGGGMD